MDIGRIAANALFQAASSGTVSEVPGTYSGGAKKCTGDVKITLEADQYYDLWSPDYKAYMKKVESGDISKKIRGFVKLENGVEVNLTELILKAGLDPDGWFDGLEDVSWDVLTAYMLGLEFEADDGKLDGKPWYVDSQGKKHEINEDEFNKTVARIKESSKFGEKPPATPYDMWSRAGYRSDKWTYFKYRILKGISKVPALSFYAPCEIMEKDFVVNNLLGGSVQPEDPETNKRDFGIARISPKEGRLPVDVSITGYFGEEVGKVTLKKISQKAKNVKWSEEEITFTIPKKGCGTKTIPVIVSSGDESDSIDFKVIRPSCGPGGDTGGDTGGKTPPPVNFRDR